MVGLEAKKQTAATKEGIHVGKYVFLLFWGQIFS